MADVKDTRHQGYANYETFTVAVLLQNNDRDIFEAWRARAKELQEEFPTEAQPEHEGQYSGVCVRLAHEIQEWINENEPERLVAEMQGNELLNDIFKGLMNAAMERVDWREVAEDFLTD